MIIKKISVYTIVLSLLCTNIAWAGKDVLDDTDTLKPLATVRPSNYLSSGIDEVTLHSDGGVTLHNNVSDKTSLSAYTHHSIKKVVSSGADNLRTFMSSHFFTVTGNEESGYDVLFTPRARGGMFGGKDPTTKCMTFDRGAENNITVCFPCYNGCGGNTGSSSQGYGGYTKDPLGNNGSGYGYGGSSGGNGHTSSLGNTAKHGAIGELADYHIKNSGGFKQFTRLHPAIKEEVMHKANYLWTHASPFVYPPSTEPLNNALVQVVYMPPMREVLGWAKDQPSLKYFTKVSNQYAGDIVTQAGHHALQHDADYKNIQSLIAGYDNVMSDRLRYTFNYHRNITKAEQYQDLDQCLEGTLINHALSLMKEDPDQFTGPNTAPLKASFQYHETLGHALLKAYGNAVDTLWCETLGACKVNASYANMGLDILQKNGPQIISLANKSGRWVIKTAGIAASTMWNDHVKHWVTDVVDWMKSPTSILVSPLNWDDKAKLLITHGVVGVPKMHVTPVHGGKAITLTTPIVEDGIRKERIIHMQITDEDIKFAERAKETHGLGEIKPADDGAGVKWDNAPQKKPGKVNDGIRIMRGKGLEAQHPSQKDDYVKIIRGGKMLDVNGDEVKPGDDGVKYPKNNPRSHINKETWKKWKHPLHPTDLGGGK